MRRALRRLFVGALLLAPSPSAWAQTVAWQRFDPLVIPSSYTQPVRFEAAIASSPTRVTLDVATGPIELHDDGVNGDLQAADGIFSVTIPAATILQSLRADDVQRPFVGFLNVFFGTTNAFRGNIFVDVYTPEIGTPAIEPLGPDAQATERVVNLVDPLFMADGNVRRVAQAFYRFYGDEFDFLNVISAPSRFQNRTHTIVRNDVDGIGVGRTDGSAQFGSSGVLRGYTLFPIPTLYDGADTSYSHETGHQWINHLNFVPFGVGVPHWPASTMASGVMGFSIGGAGGEGGTFLCEIVDQGSTLELRQRGAGDPMSFNDLDLYLMGLMSPEEVREQIVLTGLTAPPPCGGAYAGTFQRVTAATVIGTAGRRVPESPVSPRRFRAATILVSRDGLVSREMMWLYEWFTRRAELEEPAAIHSGFTKGTGHPFFVATRGRGSIDTRLKSLPDFSLQPGQAAMNVARGGTATYRISVMPTRAGFNQPVTFTCPALPAPLTCTFSPLEVTPGASGTDVTLTVRTAAAQSPVALVLAGTVMALAVARRRRRTAVGVACAPFVLAFITTCGGSTTSPVPSPTPSTPVTPATVYSITVTATSGVVTHSTILTLTVQ